MARIAKVAIMEGKSCVWETGVAVEMVDVLPVENARTADDTMNFVFLLEEKFGKVGAVLAGDTCDGAFFHFDNRYSIKFLLTQIYTDKRLKH